MKFLFSILLILLMPVVAFSQDTAQSVPPQDNVTTITKEPVPGTLTPAQQAEINRALPPSNPPKLRPAVPRVVKDDTEEEKKKTNYEWMMETIVKINAIADSLYKKNQTYSGALTEDALKEALETLETPWGGVIQIAGVQQNSFVIKVTRVSPGLCTQLYFSMREKSSIKGVLFITPCSAVQTKSVTYSYNRELAAE